MSKTMNIPAHQYDPLYRGAGAKTRVSEVTFEYDSTTANLTLVANTIGNTENCHSLIEVTSGSPTLTLPTAVGLVGYRFVIKNTGSGTAVLAAKAGQTIDGAASQNITQYVSLTVVSNGTNWILI